MQTLPPVPGEVVIHRDPTGNTRSELYSFMAYWHQKYIPGAPEGHLPIRGQVFQGPLKRFVVREMNAGRSLRFIDAPPDWLPADTAIPGSVLPCGCYLRQADQDAVLCAGHEREFTTGVEPAACGEACTEFSWGEFYGIAGPVLLCRHGMPAPGWAYIAEATQ
jgi:hypothetical protein